MSPQTGSEKAIHESTHPDYVSDKISNQSNIHKHRPFLRNLTDI